MAPMRSERGGSPPRAARASLPLPRRLIRQIARHVASSGRSLRRLEVSGRIIENFDDIENMTDEDEQMDTAVAAVACAGNAGNLPPAELDDELTSLSWLQDRNLLRGINLTSKSEEIQENKSNGQSVIIKAESGVTTPPPPSAAPPPLAPVKSPPPQTHSKPPYSFSCLIFMAIEAAPSGALPVKEIYAWIIKHFPYFKSAPQGWKNSVRHNLSLNKCFHKVAAAHGLGKGSLWTVDPQHRSTLLQLTTNAGCALVRPSADSEAECVVEKTVVNGTDRGIVNGMDRGLVSGTDKGIVNETDRGITNGIDRGIINGIDRGIINGTDRGIVSGMDRGIVNVIDSGITEPGADEYIAAATVLAMKYGPRVLERLPPAAHLVISRCTGNDHSYSGCEERKTAEALLNLAGITPDSHALVPS